MQENPFDNTIFKSQCIEFFFCHDKLCASCFEINLEIGINLLVTFSDVLWQEEWVIEKKNLHYVYLIIIFTYNKQTFPNFTKVVVPSIYNEIEKDGYPIWITNFYRAGRRNLGRTMLERCRSYYTGILRGGEIHSNSPLL